MIALRRTDVRALNRLARDDMRAAGRLPAPRSELGDEPFSAGDIVVLRQNDSRRGVDNGDRGTSEPSARTRSRSRSAVGTCSSTPTTWPA